MNIDTGNDPDVYAPDWYITLAVSGKEPLVINAEYKKRNWITAGLLSEIETLYPTGSEITTNTITKSCSRDLDAFQVKCTKMFPVGRVFMSYVQLDQCVNYFFKRMELSKGTCWEKYTLRL